MIKVKRSETLISLNLPPYSDVLDEYSCLEAMNNAFEGIHDRMPDLPSFILAVHLRLLGAACYSVCDLGTENPDEW